MNESAPATESPSGDRSPWLIGGLAAVVLVVVAAAAVLLVVGQDDVDYAPGSPEAAVQAYAEAWEAGDLETAYAALTTRAQARVPINEFRDAMSWDEDVPTRIWIEDRTDYDDRVVLDLSVEKTYDGLFGPDRDTHSLRLTLTRIDDAWRIDTPLVGIYGW